MDWPDVAQHLTGFAHLGTATPDGEPHVSVVMPCVDGDTIWIFTFASSGKAKRIASNGRVAMMWRPGAEAYVYGTAAIIDDIEVKRRLWSHPELQFDPSMFFGSVDNPDHVLVKVTPTRATLMVEGEGGGIRQLSWRTPAG